MPRFSFRYYDDVLTFPEYECIMEYECPYCDQKSTRRWNLETHIKRRHGGTGRTIPVPNMPFQSPGKPASNSRLGDIPKSRYPHNFFSASNNDPLDLQRYIIEFLRGMKEINELRAYIAPGGPNAFFTPSRYGAQPMDIGFLDWRTTFGPGGSIL